MTTGYFSTKAKQKYGSTIWKSVTGEDVEITGTGNENYPYLWDDKICVGEVVNYVRPGLVVNGYPQFRDITYV